MFKIIEIIVMGRFSKDGTVRAAKKYRAEIYKVKRGRTKAKDFGLRKAKGDYIMFIGSDMELSERNFYAE